MSSNDSQNKVVSLDAYRRKKELSLQWSVGKTVSTLPLTDFIPHITIDNKDVDEYILIHIDDDDDDEDNYDG